VWGTRFRTWCIDFKNMNSIRTNLHGVSIIWVTQVLEKSKRIRLLRFVKDAAQKIEQQTRQMEKRLKELQAA
jgi:hypothetical protein